MNWNHYGVMFGDCLLINVLFICGNLLLVDGANLALDIH
jgi:hypothetical protein